MSGKRWLRLLKFFVLVGLVTTYITIFGSLFLEKAKLISPENLVHLGEIRPIAGGIFITLIFVALMAWKI